jgi:predicted hotdog family 3-hydroxylacyl-ACP dehydratase
MDASFPPVTELLPHQGRAVMIDAVLSDTEDRIEVAAHISREHPFFVAGHGVPTWVGIELMAQAIAAHAGLSGRRARRPPRNGMLLGTRRYQVETAYFPEGMRLDVCAEREFGDSGADGGVGACTCTIQGGGRILAKATIIIVELGLESMR